jgi:hypothetical protein
MENTIKKVNWGKQIGLACIFVSFVLMFAVSGWLGVIQMAAIIFGINLILAIGKMLSRKGR